MTNYELLRAERNRLFPEALKLIKGAVVNWKQREWDVVSVHGDEDWDSFTMSFQKYRDRSPIFETITKEEYDQLKYPPEILGKPLSIVDVLMILEPFGWYVISAQGMIETLEREPTGIWFNLAIPLTHPDNDEALGKVLDLISNK